MKSSLVFLFSRVLGSVSKSPTITWTGMRAPPFFLLTDSQLRNRFLAQPAELLSVYVVGFKDVDQLLQSFLAQPVLHVLLCPISEQQPAVNRQLPSCKKKKKTTQQDGSQCWTISLQSPGNKRFPLQLHREGHILSVAI